MQIVYDAQIFRLQRYGGISRYFCEVAKRVGQVADVRARIVAPEHLNAYLAAVPSSARLAWPAERTSRFGRLSGYASSAVVRAAMTAWRPDVLHETYYFDSWRTPARTARFVTVHDMIHERFPQEFGAADPTSRAKVDAIARADHVICISESTRRDLTDLLNVPAAKLSVIHHGAHLPAPAGPDGSPPPPYLLYVGQRGGYKNFMMLARAVAASTVLRPLRIVCFGGGPATDDERRTLAALGLAADQVVHVSGSDAELAWWYAGAVCFVYPSLYEGFGIPPLEAMMCGCPVVCSNTSSLPEVVREGGDYFDPMDVESVRHAIEQVAASPSRQFELRARGRAVSRGYSWDRCAAEHLALYRQVVQGGVRTPADVFTIAVP